MAYAQKATSPLVKIIPVRQPTIDFEKGVGRYYLKGNAIMSHFLTGVNFLFPQGEQFFIESVNCFKDQVQDPQLRSELKAFCGQETQHKNQHSIFIDHIESQGYRVQGLLNWIKWYHKNFLQHLPSGLRLAFTAGCEHITASFAHSALKNQMLDDADPAMRRLLLWHAVEEMEHKHVAYDVFGIVRPKSYILRTFGLLLGACIILGNALFGLGKLIRQDFQEDRLDLKQLKQHLLNFIHDKGVRNMITSFLISIYTYLKPGFHPNQTDDQYLLDLYRPELKQYS